MAKKRLPVRRELGSLSAKTRRQAADLRANRLRADLRPPGRKFLPDLPSASEKAALTGTGTPSGSNRYVTNDDSRLTNARTPAPHAASHGAGQSDPLSGITEAQLSLNYPTHSNANDPSSGEKLALAGTSGTPGSANKYVTDGDARNTNSRTPTSHVLATGDALGTLHTISGANAGEVLRALSATTAAFDQLQYSDLGSVPSTFAPSAHAASHGVGQSDALSGITEAQLSLNFATHSNASDPTADQKAALAGTNGTPSVTNKYVTDSDARNTNARTPTAHAASHGASQSDALSGITEAQLSLNFATHSNANDPSSGQKDALAGTSGTPSATNEYVTDGDARNTNARTPTSHASSHAHGGGDALSGTTDISATNAGLSVGGQLAFPTGLGGITQVLGPTDQNLLVFAPSARSLVLGAAGAAQWTIDANGALSSGDHTVAVTMFSVSQGGNATAMLVQTLSGINQPCIQLHERGTSAALQITQDNKLDSITTDGDIRCQQIIASLHAALNLNASIKYSEVDGVNTYYDVFNFDTSKIIQVGNATRDYPIVASVNAQYHAWVASSAERMRLAGSNLMIGATSIDADLSSVTGSSIALTVVRDQSDSYGFANVANGANTSAPSYAGFKTRGAASDANTIVASGDTVLSLIGYGADGAAYRPAAQIAFAIDGTPGSSDMPGRIVFLTTADGAGTLTERARIQNDGKVGIGATAPITTLQVNGAIYAGAETSLDGDVTTAFGTPQLGACGSNASNYSCVLIGNGNSASGATLVGAHTRGTTNDANTVVQSGDTLLNIIAYGADGAAYKIGAKIAMQVDGTPGSSDMPGRILFFTTPDGSASPVERMRIASDGLISFTQANNQAILSLNRSGTGGGDALDITYKGTAWVSVYTLDATNPSGGIAIVKNGTGTGACFATDNKGTGYSFSATSESTGACIGCVQGSSGNNIIETDGNGTIGTTGAKLVRSTGAWTNGSSWRKLKDVIETFDPVEFSDRLDGVDISRVVYKSDPTKRPYISIFQDDMVQQFGFPDYEGISPQEVASVALLACKGLLQRIKRLENAQ